MASLNLLHQIPPGFCSLLQVRAFNLLHQIPSGFALFCKLGLCLFLKSSVGLPNLNMREKMKLIPLLAKTSHRVIANQTPWPQQPCAVYCSEDTPMCRSSFVFGLGSELCLFILFSQPNREVFQELQGCSLYEEKSPRVEESLAYPRYPWRANICYISLPKLGV